jgi:hypothetical protein
MPSSFAGMSKSLDGIVTGPHGDLEHGLGRGEAAAYPGLPASAAVGEAMANVSAARRK